MSDQQYDNSNRAACWPNDRKTTDTHPDYKGPGEFMGVEGYVAVWINSNPANSNAPTMRIAFTPKDENAQGTTATTSNVAPITATPINTSPPQTVAQREALAKEPDEFADEDIPF